MCFVLLSSVGSISSLEIRNAWCLETLKPAELLLFFIIASSWGSEPPKNSDHKGMAIIMVI